MVGASREGGAPPAIVRPAANLREIWVEFGTHLVIIHIHLAQVA